MPTDSPPGFNAASPLPEGAPLKVLLTGAAGQLGQALISHCPAWVQLVACRRAELNLADPAACRRLIRQERPDWVLNAAAYTAVDRAEQEPSLCMQVNAAAPQAFASVLAEQGGSLLQISTDFVFDGRSGKPYLPTDLVAPLSVYGASKAAAEQAVLTTMTAGHRYVMRTSWLYGSHGSNFLNTMIRLHRERSVLGQPLRVVADQVGCPTSTTSLAKACWQLISQVQAQRQISPLLHWSDAGAASWYDFAHVIGRLAIQQGLLDQAARVEPITTLDYPTPATRPSFSLLNCMATYAELNCHPSHWQDELATVIEDVAASVAQSHYLPTHNPTP